MLTSGISVQHVILGNEPRKKIFPKADIIKEIGYKNNQDVLRYYEKSEIAIGNSLWDEPLGRIAIEASSRKCLPIISNVGGLAESKNIGIIYSYHSHYSMVKLCSVIA